MGSPESSQSISQSVREEGTRRTRGRGGTRRTRGGERNKENQGRGRNKGRKEEVVEEETKFG